MVLIGAYNAIARYTDRFTGWRLSSNAYIETQWYLFSLVFLLGGAYVLREDRHVRVDVLYSRLSRRGQHWIDAVGAVTFLLPFSATTLWLCWPSVRNSWAVREVSPDPGGLARYPIKTAILIAFGVLFLQGVAQLVRSIDGLRREDVAGAGSPPPKGWT